MAIRYRSARVIAQRGTSLAVSLALAGCAVGPEYHQPKAPPGAFYAPGKLPAHTASAQGLAGAPQRLDLGADLKGDWWTLFRSPALDRLVTRALAHNPSLQAAQATLLQARETARAQQGGFFPVISAAFGYTHQQFSTAGFGAVTGAASGTGVNGQPVSGQPTSGQPGATGGGAALGAGSGVNSFIPTSNVFDLWNAGVNVSYTLDAWGGIRRGVEQSLAQAEYQRFALEAAYLSLTANVVSAAIAEASLNAQIRATRDVIRAEQDGLKIVAAQLSAGAVTRSVYLQQQAQLLQTQATLPPLESSLAQERTILTAYVGEFPNRSIGAEFDLTDLTLPADLPVSLPSDLVDQRPDIRESAAQLHVATAALGVATANMLPQIALSASYGSDGLVIGQLFSGPAALAYSIGAALTQPLFEGGTLLHQKRAAAAALHAAAANYRQTVLNAFANVAESLQALQYDAKALKLADQAARAARESLKLQQVQYSAGSVTYLTVLTAEQTEQTALITLAKARAARFADTVSLFQSLGGGWWRRHDVSAKIAACCGLLP